MIGVFDPTDLLDTFDGATETGNRESLVMAGLNNKSIRLGLVLLESREQPSVGPIQIDTAGYASDHILVKWKDGKLHSDPAVASSESLGEGQYKIQLREDMSVSSAVHYFSRMSNVEFAQPDYKVQLERIPNDASFNNLWGLENTAQNGGTANADIKATEAWNTNTGSGKMVVAIIDSGVDYNHPDLAANIWSSPKNKSVHGWNFVNNTSNVMDDNGHGTHIAGIIGAVGNNGIGVAGVNWHVQIMALKFLDKSGSGYLSNAVKALNWAVANGAKIVNNSYAGGGSDPAMKAAIAAARAKGVIFVAAAGNDASNNDTSPVYPANYNSDNVVTVAATDRNDRLASYSNFGRATVEIAAPGSNIYSTLPGNKYGYYSGTSMAAPEVAGALALVWDTHPDWSYKQVIQAVLKTADVVPSLTGKVATGRLDVGEAINYSFPKPSTSAKTFQVVDASFNEGVVLNNVRVTFNQSVLTTSFSAADVKLYNPDGKIIAVKSIKAVAGTSNTQFDIAFADQKAIGNYKVVVASSILNTLMVLLDQNANGTPGEALDSYTVSTAYSPTLEMSSKDVNKALKDLGKTISVIKVTDNFNINDVKVKLNITHPYVYDLKISLMAPDGTRVYLVNQRGGTGDNLTDTIFDDAASTKITAGSAPFTGSFKPETALSQFKGKNPVGTWQLIVEDMNLYYTGKLNSWSIQFNSAGVNGASFLPKVKETTPVNQRKFLAETPLIDATFWQADSRRKSESIMA